LVVKYEGENFGEGAEAFVIMRLIRRGETIGFKGVGKITKRAVGGARFEGAEGFADNIGSNRNTGLILGAMASGVAVMAMDARWVQLLTKAFDMVCPFGNR
jgi:hypothetical protein